MEHDSGDRDGNVAMARRVIDANLYMTLATADGEGRPWASPVWYAHEGYLEFLWVSRPEARHSRNLATRPEAGIVIFDSTVPEGGAEAVYVEATARELEGAEQGRGLGILSGRSVASGGAEWTPADVNPPAPHRLFRASGSALFILGPSDQRVPVDLRGA
ncbi:MAG TPA: pyridoxamine 5'-phosphate oxidase family protein [Solirubrobacterales bacterium]